MSGKAVGWAREVWAPSSVAKAVLILLADSADYDTEDCFPAVTTISRQLHISDRSVQRGLRELEAEGLIECEARRRDNTKWSTSNRYRVIVGSGVPLNRGDRWSPDRRPDGTTPGDPQSPLEPLLRTTPSNDVVWEDEAIGDDAPVEAIDPFAFPPDAFAVFWAAYPEKKGKQPAEESFAKVAKGRKVTFADLMAGVDAYIRAKPIDRNWLHPTTFLNQARWADEHGGHNGPRSDARPGRRDSVASAESMLDGAMDALNERR